MATWLSSGTSDPWAAVSEARMSHQEQAVRNPSDNFAKPLTIGLYGF
jgi:hypothetical protein